MATVAKRVTPLDAPVVTGDQTKTILPGCIAGNRRFPRNTATLPNAFKIDVNACHQWNAAHKVATYSAAHWALEYFRWITDPDGLGEPHYYEMDVTQAQWVFVDGDMDVSSVGRRDVIYSEDLSVSFSDLDTNQDITGILLGDVNGTI